MVNTRKQSQPQQNGVKRPATQGKDLPKKATQAGGKRRRRPGDAAIKEIRRYQGGGKDAIRHLIPRAPFWRLAREVLDSVASRPQGGGANRWSVQGVTALQEAAEAYLAGLFEDAQLCSVHAKRVTVFVKDMQLARRLRGEA